MPSSHAEHSHAASTSAGAGRPKGEGRRAPAGDPLSAGRVSAEGVSRYLAQHGLAPAKSRSQNHLVDAAVLAEIVALADVAPGRTVLEIGPGLGILTGALLEAGAHVCAVELDRRLADDLRRRFDRQIEAGALRLTQADVLDVPVGDLVAPPYDLVANLPYHITSPVLHHVLGAEPRPERFVLMLQREVAERIAAAPGGLSYLSVFVQYHAVTRVARIVPPTAFEPAPAVESALLVGETRPRGLSPAGEDGLWRLVQAGFRERRKMLHNVLPRQLSHIPRARFDAALAAVGIAPDRRPQTLAVAEWLSLWRALGGAV